MRRTILSRLLDIVAPPRVVFRPSTLDELKMAAFPVLMAPFRGTLVPVVGHELTEAQIQACGEFSLIGDMMDGQHKPSLQEIRDYADLQHRIVEAWLCRPSYADIIALIGANPAALSARERLGDMEKKLFAHRHESEAEELLLEITRLELFADYLLPSDFCAVIFTHAVGLDHSDIRKVSDDMLLKAAILAERGHDNPADHVAGLFTDFNRDDINLRGWYLLDQHREHPNG